MSDSPTRGTREGWEALRQRAHELHPVLLELEDARRDDRQHDCREHAGDPGQEALQHDDRREAEQADRECGGHRPAVGDTSHESLHLGDEAVGIDREPEQLRQLPDQDRHGQAVHVPDHRRLREEVGDESEPEDAAEHRDRSHQERQHRRERDRALRVAVGAEQRQERGGDHRPQRRVGPEHEYPRRPEDRVAGQTENRGVETGDRRQSGQLGIRHALGDEQRGEDQSGDEILREPGSPVGREHSHPGQRRHRPRPRVLQGRVRLHHAPSAPRLRRLVAMIWRPARASIPLPWRITSDVRVLVIGAHSRQSRIVKRREAARRLGRAVTLEDGESFGKQGRPRHDGWFDPRRSVDRARSRGRSGRRARPPPRPKRARALAALAALFVAGAAGWIAITRRGMARRTGAVVAVAALIGGAVALIVLGALDELVVLA